MSQCAHLNITNSNVLGEWRINGIPSSRALIVRALFFFYARVCMCMCASLRGLIVFIAEAAFPLTGTPDARTRARRARQAHHLRRGSGRTSLSAKVSRESAFKSETRGKESVSVGRPRWDFDDGVKGFARC